MSKEKREMIDIGATGMKTVSTHVEDTNYPSVQANTERDKRMIARAKERRATLILGMAMTMYGYVLY